MGQKVVEHKNTAIKGKKFSLDLQLVWPWESFFLHFRSETATLKTQHVIKIFKILQNSPTDTLNLISRL